MGGPIIDEPLSAPRLIPWAGSVRVTVTELPLYADPTTVHQLGYVNDSILIEVIGYTHGETVKVGDKTSSMWLQSAIGYISAAGTDFDPGITPVLPAPSPDLEAKFDYITSYQDAPQNGRILQTATVAIDAEGELPDKPLDAATILDQAGVFTHNGHHYVRTKYAKKENIWYGIPVEAFGLPTQPTTPRPATEIPPGTGKPVDTIQGPPREPAANPASSVPATQSPSIGLTLSQWLVAVIVGIYGKASVYTKVVLGRKK